MTGSETHELDRLETPERVDLTLDLAGVGSRALAFLIDAALLFAVFVGSLFVLLAAGTLIRGWAIALWWLVNFLLQWFYFATFEALWAGQTPGKRALGLRVQKTGGYPIGWTEALIRNFLRLFLDILLFVIPIGLVVMLFTRRHQRIGDLAAGTVVVRERAVSIEELRDLGYTPSADPSAAVAGGPELTLGEFELLHDFLVRRHDLEPSARQRIGQELARLLRERLTARGRLGDALRATDAEDFLARVDAAYRGAGAAAVGP